MYSTAEAQGRCVNRFGVRRVRRPDRKSPGGSQHGFYSVTSDEIDASLEGIGDRPKIERQSDRPCPEVEEHLTRNLVTVAPGDFLSLRHLRAVIFVGGKVVAKSPHVSSLAQLEVETLV